MCNDEPLWSDLCHHRWSTMQRLPSFEYMPSTRDNHSHIRVPSHRVPPSNTAITTTTTTSSCGEHKDMNTSSDDSSDSSSSPMVPLLGHWPLIWQRLYRCDSKDRYIYAERDSKRTQMRPDELCLAPWTFLARFFVCSISYCHLPLTHSLLYTL
jgi:hypothetical protein